MRSLTWEACPSFRADILGITPVHQLIVILLARFVRRLRYFKNAETFRIVSGGPYCVSTRVYFSSTSGVTYRVKSNAPRLLKIRT